MDRVKLAESREWIRAELTRCVDFWLCNGMDPVNGGVYTCLDREGKVYSTDKSVWMQGRCGWIFAWLCRLYGVRDEWLAASKSCLDFMEAHCLNREAGDRMYFTVTADGKPTQPACKGSTFKGPFHLPRMLSMVDMMMGEILEQ